MFLILKILLLLIEIKCYLLFSQMYYLSKCDYFPDTFFSYISILSLCMFLLYVCVFVCVSLCLRMVLFGGFWNELIVSFCLLIFIYYEYIKKTHFLFFYFILILENFFFALFVQCLHQKNIIYILHLKLFLFFWLR